MLSTLQHLCNPYTDAQALIVVEELAQNETFYSRSLLTSCVSSTINDSRVLISRYKTKKHFVEGEHKPNTLKSFADFENLNQHHQATLTSHQNQ